MILNDKLNLNIFESALVSAGVDSVSGSLFVYNSKLQFDESRFVYAGVDENRTGP